MSKQLQKYGRYADVEQITGISRNTLYTLVYRDLIPFHRVSRRLVLFDLSEVESWIKRSAVGKGVDRDAE